MALPWIRYISAIFFLIWYIVILLVGYSGFFEILIKFKNRKVLPLKKNKDKNNNNNNNNNEEEEEEDEELATLEGVTIIRPIKGIDPELSSCLESSFLQNYPRDKIQLLFCVDNPHDPSIPLIHKLIQRYPTIDAEILISENYNEELKISSDHYGPNPKVNNLAKGFKRAKFDILWIMDSNVWASSNILRNSVITLNSNLNNGRRVSNSRPVKLVHHVPLAIYIDEPSSTTGSNNAMNDDFENRVTPVASDEDFSDTSQVSQLTNRKVSKLYSQSKSKNSINNKKKKESGIKNIGAKLDEMFLHTSHSKFYVSLNNLAIAPCVNGKSNIYRRTDLDQSVKLIPYKDSEFFRDAKVKQDAYKYTRESIAGNAIKLFARYIGEDNMIGIALWENCNGRTGLTGDVVIQPLSSKDNYSIKDYSQRRVRWLRVRKYMVLLATLIEPSTESIVCGIYGTYAISTLFLQQHPWFSLRVFFVHMLIWMATDFVQYNILRHHVKHQMNDIIYLPQWMKNIHMVYPTKGFCVWLCIWCIREILALPIWIIAMFGHEIDWRGAPFRIKKDLTAEEL
ncbi:HSX11 [Candida oxycetoniae]|uniref:Ceramide glucosyltransferase n=1 Tax=Candida oxycetoniae TaxID=497107 RepID=A0AAI9SYV6_9ASCO|nr:HSX11 [Candida oxycetoniae]KAI3405315.2 HSX11 [Candida oxycetoniae]